LPGDCHRTTGCSTGGGNKRQRGHEREGKGSNGTVEAVENTSETPSSTATLSEDLRESSKHFEVVNGG
jgi:hypothetical protein